MKNSFVMYTDYLEDIEDLEEEERGVLFTAILSHAAGVELPEMSRVVNAVFKPIRRQMDRDKEKSRAGKNHWNWKGGITPANKADRSCSRYESWRKSVFDRDDYTCQICRKKGGNLEAHHIKKFSEYKKLRFDIHNGMTLCKKCHRALHENER